MLNRHDSRKRKRSEAAVALAIYGDELSLRDRKIVRAYSKGTAVAAIAHAHGLSAVMVYLIVNKMRNKL